MNLAYTSFLNNFKRLHKDWADFAVILIKVAFIAISLIALVSAILWFLMAPIGLDNLKQMSATSFILLATLFFLVISTPAYLLTALPLQILIANKFINGGSIRYYKLAFNDLLKPLFKRLAVIYTAAFAVTSFIIAYSLEGIRSLVPNLNQKAELDEIAKFDLILNIIASISPAFFVLILLNFVLATFIYLLMEKHFYGNKVHDGVSNAKTFKSKLWRVFKAGLWVFGLTIAIVFVEELFTNIVSYGVTLVANPEMSLYIIGVFSFIAGLVVTFYQYLISSTAVGYSLKQPSKEEIGEDQLTNK